MQVRTNVVMWLCLAAFFTLSLGTAYTSGAPWGLLGSLLGLLGSAMMAWRAAGSGDGATTS